MVMTTEARIQLLEKARAAKKSKQEERKLEKQINPPPRGRRPKQKTEEKTLDLVDNKEVKDEELDDLLQPEPKNVKRTSKKINPVPEPEEEPEVEPEVVEKVEVRKIKKPKKRIVRKIIKEQYDSETTEEEYEELVYKVNKHKSKPKPVEQPPELPEQRQVEIRQTKTPFNIFGY